MTEIEWAEEGVRACPDSGFARLTLFAAKQRRDAMLKFKDKTGTIVAVLDDDSSEPIFLKKPESNIKDEAVKPEEDSDANVE